MRALFLLLTTSAAACAHPVIDKCAADAKRLCPGSDGSPQSIVRCIAGNEEKLSPDCRVAHIEEKARFFRTNPCGADIRKLCGGREKKPGAIGECLAKNRDKVSPACQRYQRDVASRARKR